MPLNAVVNVTGVWKGEGGERGGYKKRVEGEGEEETFFFFYMKFKIDRFGLWSRGFSFEFGFFLF